MSFNIATAVMHELGTKKPEADENKSGQWILFVGPLLEPTIKLNTEKGAAIYTVNASFLYVGGTAGKPPVSVPPVMSELQLTRESSQKNADTLKVKVAGKYVLIKGDEIKDEYDNAIKVTGVSQKMATA
ncbi:hypothetical protein [Shewanella surugensis]|uniref:Head decoration protein n=1 Tax=Shewanella surugensis TaxID=212020 RepID=A0ABT0L682_9GAMM|nr:hypothetical protein [Shewanella surugensis]MCL1123197.1 hypothetical protein [Shewanella surugensis]